VDAVVRCHPHFVEKRRKSAFVHRTSEEEDGWVDAFVPNEDRHAVLENDLRGVLGHGDCRFEYYWRFRFRLLDLRGRSRLAFLALLARFGYFLLALPWLLLTIVPSFAVISSTSAVFAVELGLSPGFSGFSV